MIGILNNEIQELWKELLINGKIYKDCRAIHEESKVWYQINT